MQHSDSTFKGAGDLELYSQNWRPEQNVRAVLGIVHGFGEHGGRYMNIVNHLVPMGISVHSFDHRGHGRSGGKRGHILRWTEFRRDVHNFLAVIRKQEEDTPLYLMGHSMGGLIVLDYLLHHQEKVKAVIASSPLLAQPEISPVLILLSRFLSNIWPGFSIETKLDVNTISRDPQVVEAYLQDPLVHSTASARFGTELSAAIEQTHRLAPDFRLPLMIVHGESDHLVPLQGSQEFFDNLTISDKEIRIYKGGFHETHNDIDKQTFLTDIEQWIGKHL